MPSRRSTRSAPRLSSSSSRRSAIWRRPRPSKLLRSARTIGRESRWIAQRARSSTTYNVSVDEAMKGSVSRPPTLLPVVDEK